jgi:hypothetical protein
MDASATRRCGPDPPSPRQVLHATRPVASHDGQGAGSSSLPLPSHPRHLTVTSAFGVAPDARFRPCPRKGAREVDPAAAAAGVAFDPGRAAVGDGALAVEPGTPEAGGARGRGRSGTGGAAHVAEAAVALAVAALHGQVGGADGAGGPEAAFAGADLALQNSIRPAPCTRRRAPGRPCSRRRAALVLAVSDRRSSAIPGDSAIWVIDR